MSGPMNKPSEAFARAAAQTPAGTSADSPARLLAAVPAGASAAVAAARPIAEPPAQAPAKTPSGAPASRAKIPADVRAGTSAPAGPSAAQAPSGTPAQPPPGPEPQSLTGTAAAVPVRDSHCSGCGAPYPPGIGWPRTCPACGTAAYRNPLPVAVALLPVRDAQGTGLVVITRTIEPQLGGTALPGGFIDHGEDWRQAVVRELREETGIGADADQVCLADARSSPAGHLLLFGLLPERALAELPLSVPTDETTGWHVLREPTELAFPLHTEAAKAWFAGNYTPANPSRSAGPSGESSPSGV